MEELLKEEFIRDLVDYGDKTKMEALKLWENNKYEYMDSLNICRDNLKFIIIKKEEENV